MFLSDLYKKDKDEIQESIDLVQEIISLAPRRSFSGSADHDRVSNREKDHTSHIRNKAVTMHPGNDGVMKRTKHHLEKAQERLAALDPKKDHNPEFFQEVIQIIRKIKDILQQYKGSKA